MLLYFQLNIFTFIEIDITLWNDICNDDAFSFQSIGPVNIVNNLLSMET